MGVFGDALAPFMRTVNVAATETVQQAAEHERDRVLREGTARAGIAPVFRQVVDGTADAPLAVVRPESEVVFLWSYLPEAVRDSRAALLARSPDLKGHYKASIMTFVDDADGGEEPEKLITAETLRVVIVPTVPYARRLEVGKDKHGRPFVKQVDPHIVERTTIQQRSIFGNVAEFEFGYMDLSGAHELSAAGRIPRGFINGRWLSKKSPRTRHGFLETHVRYPAMTITPRMA